MKLRQEQTVFVVTLLVLGVLSWSMFGGTTRRTPRARSGAGVEFTHYPAPSVEVALADASRTPELRRELFSPPRDTVALPPLALQEPPRHPLEVLLPPGVPGLAARAFGDWLRVAPRRAEAPDLFAGPLQEEAEDAAFFEVAAPTVVPTSPGLFNAAPEDPFADETPAEQEARFAGYRRRYDWVKRGGGRVEFGRIENEDRYGLKVDLARAGEALHFVRLDPETGRETQGIVGAPPMVLERNTVEDFDFAATVANELEVRLLELGQPLQRGDYPAALELAAYAVRRRHEAPRALEIAEQVYRMCLAQDPTDPAPRLGLAAALEAGFRFDEALAEYRAIEAEFPSRAEAVVRQGLLQERFLLFDAAEERLRHAVTLDRRSWEARFGLGSFLARRGRYAEALEHLEATGSGPSAPELLHVRVSLRVAQANAHFALGRLPEARRLYELALAADPDHQVAQAGRLALDRLERGAWRDLADGGDTIPGDADDSDEGIGGAASPGAEAGFERLLAGGLDALWSARWSAARDRLTLAVEADPLRANHPLAALSFLAWTTGHDADAMSFVERALECDPTDVYASFLQGLLLGERDDFEGARAALLNALEGEVDFEDALVWLGEMSFRLGRFEDAERFLERALSIDDSRSDVLALRGVNLLRLERLSEARTAFARAEQLTDRHPTALAGLAWCAYRDGRLTDALNRLANLDDARRDEAEDDPWRLWAREQIERITDHEEKVEWRDGFQRARLVNGWLTREGTGLLVSLLEGAVKVSGTFDRNGVTQVYREYVASDFVALSADVYVSAPGSVRAGLFVARERQRRQGRDVVGEASVARHADGSLQVRFVHQSQPEEVTDMQQDLPLDRWVRLSITRSGESSDTRMTMLLDGIPLVEDVRVASLGSANSPLLVGLFVEGQTGRAVDVRMDNVAVVYRGNR